ncbi:MAG: type I-C CRISPR-associated protein Cas8c/Csd1 [Magnetococcales bacterium]|nr:type I-C CRISPR-associated protein Cas8c/Csd1 [Magnetococcales bacterium]
MTSERFSSELEPLFHMVQQAHIEITLDGNGQLLRAVVVEKEPTLIPTTEKSATARTSAIVPHPLSDHVKYCAQDFPEDEKNENIYFKSYRELLDSWCSSPYAHIKARVVLNYLCRGTLFQDLVQWGVLPVDDQGRLLTQWEHRSDLPPLFKQLVKDPKSREYKPGNALIRWVIQLRDDLTPETWKDISLRESWIRYVLSTTREETRGLCMVTGGFHPLAEKHPSKIRHGKDGAKLISNKKENESDFIYLGRFASARQVAGVSADVSQKAHNALRWLIGRQSFRNGDQVVVAWAVSGEEIPDPLANTWELQETESQPYAGDAGQTFVRSLAKRMAGYQSRLGPATDIVVLGLDSATPGRMSVTYYRDLTGSEFLQRIEAWHSNLAWPQDYGKEAKRKQSMHFIGAPSPKDIAEVVAYGRRLDDKLRKATVERLLPCIIDGIPLPRDLVTSVVRRVSQRYNMEVWEWEKGLGIACALFKGAYRERNYAMTLEVERTSRDYLFGRLLAIAEHMEALALNVAGEKRVTNAARLMQRFADRPFSTWRTLELNLSPYKSRLQANRAGYLYKMTALLDEVITTFHGDDFLTDTPLSGEFLLGYHCQRQALKYVGKEQGLSGDDATEN